LPRRKDQRFAGVSSFGFGGTNAHVVLTDPPKAVRRPKSEPRYLMLSAQTEAALRTLADQYAARLTQESKDDVDRMSLRRPTVASACESDWSSRPATRRPSNRRSGVSPIWGDRTRQRQRGLRSTATGLSSSFFPGTAHRGREWAARLFAATRISVRR
jgi:hypothetical protein